MLNIVYVAAGGAIGAALRYLAGKGAVAAFGHGFPYGTLGVNVVGSLLMGLLVGWLAKHSVAHQGVHLFVAIGLLGGFTTFSSFSLDAVTLIQRGEIMNAGIYILASMAVSILALLGGLYLVRHIA